MKTYITDDKGVYSTSDGSGTVIQNQLFLSSSNATVLSSSLKVAGGDLTVSGTFYLSGTMTQVAGGTTTWAGTTYRLSGAFGVSGAMSQTGSLIHSGTTTLDGGNTYVTGGLNVLGTTIVSGTMAVTASQGNFGFLPYATNYTTVPVSMTITNQNAGVVLLSSSIGAVMTIVMPNPTASMGAIFAFRNTNPDANVHNLTASQGIAAGGKAFCDGIGVSSSANFVLSGAATFICDGANFQLIGQSGSVKFGVNS